ncbi:MAG: HD domain-containing protein [Anaerolineae bacterium]|nr:HD domain-containing protein [Anaerolineae bacterium]MDW8099238.1 HD domain-containing protein [Anaerolineae bacterium]
MVKRVELPERWVKPDTLAYEVLSFVARQRQPVWLVGGAVRDRLLRRETHDLDLVVPADAAALARQVADHFNGDFYLLDPRRDFGRALLPAIPAATDDLTIPDRSAQPLIVDVVRLQGPQLEDDLRARDFTINAMAVLLSAGAAGELIDPLGGMEDLKRGILRLASEHALRADPVRLLRAPRLAGELGLRLSPELIQAIRETAPLLAFGAAERVRDELWRMIGQTGCARAVRVLHHLQLLAVVLPEMAALVDLQQSPPHHWDVFEHTIQTMQAADRLLMLIWGEGRPQDVPESLMWEQLVRYAEPLRAHLSREVSSGHPRAGWLRWLAMAHDWGKALTRTVEADGRVRFLNHERQGARLVEDRLFLLRFSREEMRHLGTMVRLHMRPFALLREGQEPSRRAIYRFFRDAGAMGVELLLCSLADHRATYGADLDLVEWRDRVGRVAQMLAAWLERREETLTPEPLLDGHTLIRELGIAPGPEVGRLLDAVYEAQVVGEVRDQVEALELARRLWGERSAEKPRE